MTKRSLFGEYLLDASFWTPHHLVDSAWLEHAPFAFWLIQALEPRVLVELGAHKGFSYLSFCQAVKDLGLNTSCYAIDTWQGDEHAGFYGSEVLETLRQHHDPKYKGFSTLIQQTFDDAVEFFQSGSIDLLHLDGRHYYNDVSHDFDTWRSRLSDRAVVIFHDTNVRDSGFGVYRFWSELREKYPHFEFLHGHGLGVLGVGKDLPESMHSLFSASNNDAEVARIRAAYSRLGAALGDRHTVVKNASGTQNIQTELTEIASEKAGLQKTLLQLTAENDHLKTLQKQHLAKTKDLQRELSKRDDQILTLRAEIASHVKENSQQVASVSWRLTSPLRRFARRFPSFTARMDTSARRVRSLVASPKPQRISEIADNLRTISESQLFDSEWYVQQNRDVLTAAMDPVAHYILYGAEEGRNPNPLFDSQWYVEQNPDVRLSKQNPLLHYLQEGSAQGRDPHPLFLGDWYLEQNPDVKQAGLDPLAHYLLAGAKADRNPNMLFDTDWYLERYPEARTSGLSAISHYLSIGAAEGLDPHPLFDSDWYLEQYTDANGINPLAHFLRNGMRDNRNPSPLFDSEWYLKQNPDFKETSLSPFEHYMRAGAKEGLSPNHLFDSKWYLQTYSDVQKTGLNPLEHYVRCGFAENHDPSPLFSTSLYLQNNQDVAVVGTNPLAHYLGWGAKEGRLAQPATQQNSISDSSSHQLDLMRQAGTNPSKKTKLVVIGHDAYLGGAQLLALNLVRHLKQSFGLMVEVVLLNGGPLESRFREIAPTTVVHSDVYKLEEVVSALHAEGYRWAICNTVVTARCVRVLRSKGFEVVSLIHELPTLIKSLGLQQDCTTLTKQPCKVVFPTQIVQERFEHSYGSLGKRAVVRPQGVSVPLIKIDGTRARVLKELGIPSDGIVVLNVGYGHLRKGIDCFLQLARSLGKADSRFHFVWVGDFAPELKTWLEHDLTSATLRRCFHHVPGTDNLPLYYQSADLFALTSREDPFPTVVLEALTYGLPVVAFDEGGGYVEILKDKNNGALVPYLDVGSMSDTIVRLVGDPAMVGPEARSSRSERARMQFDPKRYAFELLRLFDEKLQSVSVIVPNYNYAHYLEERLKSIFDQSYPIYELIVCDDASTDDSLLVLEKISASTGRHFETIKNKLNSNSVSQQWIKGSSIAQSDLIWIAEADDSCSSDFLDVMCPRMTDSEVNLAFSNSSTIGSAGEVLAPNYDNYYSLAVGDWLSKDIKLEGMKFLEKFLSVRNLILNVSSVVFRRSELLRVLSNLSNELSELRVAGDWRVYVELCKRSGLVEYVCQPLNAHRRHQQSVTTSLEADRHFNEIKSMHELVTGIVDADYIRAKQATYQKELAAFFFNAPAVPRVSGHIAPNFPISATTPTSHFFDIAVATLFRNEALYLKEWIEFHRLVGVQHFYLYNNLSSDDYLTALAPYVEQGLVTLVEWPFGFESFDHYVSIQLAAQQHALQTAVGNSRWLAMIDVDEFLCPVTADDLPNFLSDYEEFGGLCVNWQMFGTNHVANLSADMLLVESLTAAAPPTYDLNLHVKSIVRPERVSAWSSPHFAHYKPGFCQVNADKIRFEGHLSPYVSCDRIRLNHYWFRDEAHYRESRFRRALTSGLTEDTLNHRYVECNREEDHAIARFVPALRTSIRAAHVSLNKGGATRSEACTSSGI